MKNAIVFFSFNFFLIIQFLYIHYLEKPAIKKNLSSQVSQRVENFHYVSFSDAQSINIYGKNLLRKDNESYIENLGGYYINKDNKIFFSAMEGIYKESDNFTLKNKAKIFFDNNQIISNSLSYDFKKEKISSAGRTIIIIDNIKIEGSNFIYDINKRRLQAEKIKGKI